MRIRSLAWALGVSLLLTLACLLIPAFTRTAAAQTGSVAGRVSNTEGDPVAGVRVEAYSSLSETVVAETTTGITGDYQLDGISPGACRVRFARDDATYLSTWYDDKASWLLADNVVVEDGVVTPGIDGTVQRGGVLSGTVVSEVGSAPMADVEVVVYLMKWNAHQYSLEQLPSVETGANGRYRKGPLANGAYLVEFKPPESYRYNKGEWYNNAPNQESAEPVVVRASAETKGIDAQLPAGARISGRVRDTGGANVDKCTVSAMVYDNATDQWIVQANGETKADGTYNIGPVFKSSCRIHFEPKVFEDGHSNHIQEYYDDKSRIEDATKVQLTKGSTRTGIDAVLRRMGSISGKVAMDSAEYGDPLFKECEVSISTYRKTKEGWVTARSGTNDAAGNYSVLGLVPGEYIVTFTPPRPLWESEWFDDKLTMEEANPVTVEEGKNTSKIDAKLRFKELLDSGVIKGECSNYSTILESLGMDYTELQVEDLNSPWILDQFTSIFVDCSPVYVVSPGGITAGPLRSFVQKGGQAFLCDFAGYQMVTKSFPGFINFVSTDGDVQQGNKQSVKATVADKGLKAYLDSATAEIEYDHGGWVAVRSVASGVTRYLTGTVQTFYSGKISASPLLMSFAYGRGHVFYSTYHDDRQGDLGESILAYLLDRETGQNKWYIAEGCTNGGMETWVLVQNPNTTQANIQLTYMTEEGKVDGPAVAVPPQSRITFNVAETCPGRWQVSTMVTSDVPIVAERTVFGGDRTWATGSIGARTPAKTWYLAEGCTAGGMETWILVQNPGEKPADVSLTYMTPGGPVAGPSTTLAGNSRTTFNVADIAPEQWDLSTKVTSNVAVVAERSMFGNGRAWGAGSVGVVSPNKTWYLAEGCTNGGMETWILVQNPNEGVAEVSLEYMTSSGIVPGPSVVMPANSRMSFAASDTVRDCWDVSTKVTSDKGVIAERAMYGGGRVWGTGSIGAFAPMGTWYLADGCTEGGMETWVLVQNPSEVNATVNLTYMTPGGTLPGPSASIPPKSRVTFNVADLAPGQWEVSTVVNSSENVVVERSMYGGGRTWATDSIGRPQ